jgi:ATP-binding cassette subfamily B protein
LLLAITAAGGLMRYLQGRWTEMASQGVAYDIRNAIHAKLASLSFAYHDQSETGDLLSRSIQDVDRLRFITGRAILHLAEASVLMLGTMVLLLFMNPALAALTSLTLPLLGWRAFRFGQLFRPLSLQIQRQLGTLTGRVEQNLRGARVVKAFAQQEKEIERFEAQNERWFDLSARAIRMRSFEMPLLDLIGNVGTVAIVGFGGYLVIQDRLSLGELVAFSTYLAQLVRPVRRLGMIVPAIAMAISSGERILEILDAEPDIRDSPDAAPLHEVAGEVRFEGVSLSYFGRERILEDVSFVARPGETVALLGTTGSGKTSIINLIPRFYDPTEGRILVDGKDIRTITLQSLRSQIGIVLQDTTLFATTIRENVAFGTPEATESQIVESAVAAQAHEFITEMSEGYETAVGEKGDTLSGGQKQRIAIARAILHNPAILILDDATASVDTQTELLIQKALENLMEGRTTFVIAQRLSTIRRAHQVLVMDRGRIVAHGTHDELRRTSGLYVDIYNLQLKSPESSIEEAGA